LLREPGLGIKPRSFIGNTHLPNCMLYAITLKTPFLGVE
jgi:hypothetical protein